MKKKIFLAVFGFLFFVPSIYAANFSVTGVQYAHNQWDPAIITQENWHIVAYTGLAGVMSAPGDIDVSIRWPNSNVAELTYDIPMYEVKGIHQHYAVLASYYPDEDPPVGSPIDTAAWEEITYDFSINGIIDPLYSITHESGAFVSFPVATMTGYDSTTGYLTWTDVLEADFYQVRIYDISTGLPVTVNCFDTIFDTDFVLKPEYFTGDINAVGILALEFGPQPNSGPWSVVNSSQYWTVLSRPVPVPATILLLGSSLIGLLVLRRKFRRH